MTLVLGLADADSFFSSVTPMLLMLSNVSLVPPLRLSSPHFTPTRRYRDNSNLFAANVVDANALANDAVQNARSCRWGRLSQVLARLWILILALRLLKLQEWFRLVHLSHSVLWG